MSVVIRGSLDGRAEADGRCGDLRRDLRQSANQSELCTPPICKLHRSGTRPDIDMSLFDRHIGDMPGDGARGGSALALYLPGRTSVVVDGADHFLTYD
jgi:hypothetical protein